MLYMVGIIMALLMTHSIYSLLEKYKGREPLWIKGYSIIYLAYVSFIVPTYIVMDLSEKFNWSNAFTAFSMLFACLAIFMIIVNMFPKSKSR